MLIVVLFVSIFMIELASRSLFNDEWLKISKPLTFEEPAGLLFPRNYRGSLEVSRYGEDGNKDLITDEYGRRVNPNADPSYKNRERFMLLIGGSYVAGNGLSWCCTLSEQINKIQQEYEAYNYGLSGAAANYHLRFFETVNLKEQVPQAEGVALFFHYPFHYRRINSGFFKTKTYKTNAPIYELVDNEVVYRGAASSAYPLRTIIYWVAGKSVFLSKLLYEVELVQYEKRDSRSIHQTIQNACGIYRRMKKQLETSVKASFLVIFSPFSQKQDSKIELQRCLDQQGVEYLDFEPIADTSWKISGGVHPSVNANQALAEKLLDRLSIKRKEN